MADHGPSDPQDAPRESLQEAREAAEETVQKLEELEVRLDQGGDSSERAPVPALPPRSPGRYRDLNDPSNGDTVETDDSGYAAPSAPRENIDISQLDTGHPDGGPE